MDVTLPNIDQQKTNYDINAIRAEFPILATEINGILLHSLIVVQAPKSRIASYGVWMTYIDGRMQMCTVEHIP